MNIRAAHNLNRTHTHTPEFTRNHASTYLKYLERYCCGCCVCVCGSVADGVRPVGFTPNDNAVTFPFGRRAVLRQFLAGACSFRFGVQMRAEEM